MSLYNIENTVVDKFAPGTNHAGILQRWQIARLSVSSVSMIFLDRP